MDPEPTPCLLVDGDVERWQPRCQPGVAPRLLGRAGGELRRQSPEPLNVGTNHRELRVDIVDGGLGVILLADGERELLPTRLDLPGQILG